MDTNIVIATATEANAEGIRARRGAVGNMPGNMPLYEAGSKRDPPPLGAIVGLRRGQRMRPKGRCERDLNHSEYKMGRAKGRALKALLGRQRRDKVNFLITIIVVYDRGL